MPCRCVPVIMCCVLHDVPCDMYPVSCDMPQELLVKSSGEIDRLHDELDDANKRYTYTQRMW